MKNNNLVALLACALLCTSFSALAQLDTPRSSQMASVMQRIGTTDIYIKYSRPSVKEREIWGKLVPYGMNNLGFGTAKESPWRAGANENTIIKFTNDVTIGEKSIPAGKYGLHINVKDANNATIIVSKNHSAWGSYFYEPSEDVAHIDVQTTSGLHVEQLTYEFLDVTPTSATATLKWGKKQIPFKIEVDVSNVVMAKVRKDLQGQLGFNRQNWEQAAGFILQNEGDMNEALTMIDKAIAGQFFSQKTFQNTALKAQILTKMGKTQDALSLVDEASTMANTRQLNALGYQMLGIKDFDRALKFFKQNVANNPKDANGYDSLGDAYKQMGDKKNAIKHLKKALTLNPNPQLKANTEKLLKELGVM